MVELSWSSVAFLSIVRHGVDLDFISFSFVGGLRGAEPSSLFLGTFFSLLVPYYRDAEYILISLALHRREVEKGHTFLF